jgi:hypothetical protein
MTDSTGGPEDARIAAARERLLADARRARGVGDQVAARFDPRRGERDPPSTWTRSAASTPCR